MQGFVSFSTGTVLLYCEDCKKDCNEAVGQKNQPKPIPAGLAGYRINFDPKLQRSS